MIRKALIAIVLLLVLLVGAVVYYLDSLVQSGIEVAGSRVLGTPVVVDSVSLLPLTGSGSIAGLTIANPEGFTAPYAFQLGEVSLALNVRSVMSDLVEIDSVIIDSPTITYENTLRSDNIRALLANLPAGSGDQSAPSEGPGKELIIHEFVMRSPRLDLITPVASAPITMSDIRLTDIGTGNGGATAAQVIQQILARVNRAIVEGNLPRVEEYRQRVRERLDEAESEAREAVDDAVEDLGNRLQDLLN